MNPTKTIIQNQPDVATFTAKKAALSGGFQLLVGAALLWFSVTSLGYALGGYRIDWWFTLLSLSLLLMGWFFFATGVRRLREALDQSFYVRAGHEGLAFRLPEATWSSLLLGYRVIEESLPWSMVSRYYPYSMSMNGVPMASEVRVETLAQGRFSIPSLYFVGSREQLTEKIRAAAGGKDISLLDSLARLTEQLKGAP
jgi:hypothetical protein